MKRLTILSMVAILVATSCQEQDQVTPKQTPKADQQAIDNFIHFIDFNRKELQKQPTLNKDEITRFVMASIPSFEKQYGVSLSATVNPRNNLQGRAAYIGAEGIDILQDMVYYAETAADENAYLSNINSLNEQILNLDISDESKSYLLTTIGMHAGLVDYLGDYDVMRRAGYGGIAADPATSAGGTPKCDGWWSCWGRCTFSVIGGAGMGALTGAAAGGGTCTVVLPVIGTVTCGSVGAVVGAVMGGMSGSRVCE